MRKGRGVCYSSLPVYRLAEAEQKVLKKGRVLVMLETNT